MFVNPIGSFSVSNAYRNNNSQNIKNNQQAPAMQPALKADTVSFGEGNHNKKANPLKTLVLATALSGAVPAAITSCAPDYESNTSLESSTIINLKDYHQCGGDSIPVIIPGGKDTVYIKLPPDTLVIEKPGEIDTVVVEKWDTAYIDRTDTLWLKPDTVYIPKKPHFEMNDSIKDDIKDFDIPTEGNGDFIYRFEGNNEYEQLAHNLLFNGFFSSERKSSFTDYIVDYEDPKNPKTSYYRIDYSASPANGSRVVQLYKPANGIHNLPNDKETGEAGWRYAGQFTVKKGLSEEKILQLAVRNIDNELTTKYYKNENRGPGNMYKEWELDNGEMPKTTVKNIKAYKIDLDDLD